MATFYTLPSGIRIGVLRGGSSPEYDISIKTGSHILNNLRETHQPVDIFISRDGKWHMQGVERTPDRILNHVDVVFNALHGTFGEDGHVQDILNRHGIKYTGSDKYSSAISMNKWLTKEKAKSVGIKTPLAFIVRQEDSIPEKARAIWSSLPHPLIVKPACSGSSFGLYKVNTFDELISVLETVLSGHGSAVVEEYITGKEASCGVIDDFRGRLLYTLPTVETRPENQFFSPGNFSESEKKEIARIAELVHKTLELEHFSKSDFIVSPRRGVYFLETNTSPKIGDKSPLSKSLEAVGVSTKEFLHHLLGLALNK